MINTTVYYHEYHHNHLQLHKTRQQNGATALISNVIQDRVEIVRLLLDAGAEQVETEMVCWVKVTLRGRC